MCIRDRDSGLFTVYPFCFHFCFCGSDEASGRSRYYFQTPHEDSQRSTTVSYTHLDVYKRQRLRIASVTKGAVAKSISATHKGIKSVRPQICFSPSTFSADVPLRSITLSTVSYTHLVAKVRQQVEEEIIETGKRTTIDLGIHGLHPELIRIIGKMKYRSSYGQNPISRPNI